MIYKKFLFVGIGLLMIGCPSNETQKLKTDLQRLEVRLKDANKIIESLMSENSDLSKKLEESHHKSIAQHIQFSQSQVDLCMVSIVKELGPCVWGFEDYDKPIPREIVRNGTADDLIKKLNNLFKRDHGPEVTLLKVEDETAFLRISESQKFTEQMGTTGATCYMNSIIYTLFSLKPVKCIDLDFEEGSHASPGTFCPGQNE